MMSFLNSLALWQLLLALNVWLIGTAFVGLWFVRRYVQPWMRLSYDDAYYGAAVVQSVMLLYGLIAALIAVGNWSKYSQVSDIVSGEATAIVSLWRDLGYYPEPLRSETQNLLRGYTEQVIHGALPRQSRGEIPSEGVEWMDRLQARLVTFEPASESQKIFHAETLRAFNDLVQQRRKRLDSMLAELPSVLWYVLLPGAMGCVVLGLFFCVESATFQAILLGGLAGFLALVLFVIIALDHPFQGPVAVTADSYRLVYDQHMKK
jgi:hypothetical protein